MKKTKIVCTIGPKTESVEMLSELLKAGMNVMRMNFSHGSHEEHKQRIVNLKKACELTGLKAAVLLDTKGPEIRTIKLKDGKDVDLVAGQKFTITTDSTVVGDETRVAVTYKGLTKDLKAGDIVLIDEDRHEYTDCRERGSTDCGEHVLASEYRGDGASLTALPERVCVLEDDDRRVYSHSYAEYEPGHAHRVYRHASYGHEHQRYEYADRHRERDDDRRLHAAEEHEDYEGREDNALHG